MALSLAGTLYGATPSVDGGGADAAMAEVEALRARASTLSTLLDRAEVYYEREVEPLRRVLRRYGADEALASRIATSLVREANRSDLEPRLLLAVLLVENPWLDPEIRSPVGAVGLMQVMPVHEGQWGCGDDLEDVEMNICHGTRIFAHYIQRTGGDLERALLRYNGCVNGTNTPNCHEYPSVVLARAGSPAVLPWLHAGRGPVAASK